MKLDILPQIFCICRLDSTVAIPDWVLKSYFYSITKTSDELSIVCEQKYVPTDMKIERDFRALKVLGPLDFNLTGILSSIANPLAKGKISIFAISTFDTDYVLVRIFDLENALGILKQNGFSYIP